MRFVKTTKLTYAQLRLQSLPVVLSILRVYEVCFLLQKIRVYNTIDAATYASVEAILFVLTYSLIWRHAVWTLTAECKTFGCGLFRLWLLGNGHKDVALSTRNNWSRAVWMQMTEYKTYMDADHLNSGCLDTAIFLEVENILISSHVSFLLNSTLSQQRMRKITMFINFGSLYHPFKECLNYDCLNTTVSTREGKEIHSITQFIIIEFSTLQIKIV